MYGLGFTNVTNTGPKQSGTAKALTGAADLVGMFVGLPGAGEMFSTIAESLHIGRGRNEADQITPTQNKFGDFLAKVSAYIPIAPNVQALTQLANNLSQAWVGFQQFINDEQQFPDGRASRQAYATLSPLVDGFQTGIAQRIAQLGGGSMMSRIFQGSGTPSLAVPTYGGSDIPQSGMLPYYPPNYVSQAGIGSGPMVPVLLAGVAAWFLFGRKSR